MRLPVAAARVLFALFALLPLAGCKSTASVPTDDRPTDPACTPGTPVASITDGGTCRTAADCAPAPNVSCLLYADVDASFCNYDACEVDTDCAEGGVCVCASATGATTTDTWNLCAIGGNCRIDSDCNPVHYCSPSSVGCGTAVDWYCHTPRDGCMNDTDCSDYSTCQYVPSAGRWSCVSFSACPDLSAPR